MIQLSQEQVALVTRLVGMGVPFPIALAAATDPAAAARGARDGLELAAFGLNEVLDLPTKALRASRKIKKRRASAYNKRFATEYKKLKKKHPRTKHATLMKRAHAAARKGGKK